MLALNLYLTVSAIGLFEKWFILIKLEELQEKCDSSSWLTCQHVIIWVSSGVLLCTTVCCAPQLKNVEKCWRVLKSFVHHNWQFRKKCCATSTVEKSPSDVWPPSLPLSLNSLSQIQVLLSGLGHTTSMYTCFTSSMVYQYTSTSAMLCQYT